MAIVIGIGALMLVPAGAIALSTAATHAQSTAGPSPAIASHATPSAGQSSPALNGGPVTGAQGSLATSRAFPAPVATHAQVTAATSALGSSIDRLTTSGANPSTLAMLERLQAGIASGAINPLAVHLPSLTLLTDPISSPRDVVSTNYAQSPAPMGLGDFGLGTTPYELNTTAVSGTVSLSSYNATAGTFYEDSAPSFQNATPLTAAGNPYDSGIQLNTVLVNVTFPGSSSDPYHGVFWTQNVLLVLGNQMQFVDNVWNWSTSGATLNQGTLFSYGGVLVPGEFYYDYGPKLPVAFPMTIQLFNNATVNKTTGQDVLTYGYRVTEGTKVYTGIYDTIVFNSPTGSTTHLPPQFRVNGNVYTPAGTLFDSELVFCGPGAGANSVITSASGQLSLAYLNTAGTTWVPPTAAYDYGADTGESAIGVAITWTGTTAGVSQGPSLLYGLWGTTNGAGSGTMQFSGYTTPNYAFVFIGEYVGGSTYYPAYAPTNTIGVISTLLPPTLPTPFTAYGLLAYADEFAPFPMATFSTAQANYPITLTFAHGTFDAPLYMNGEAQATSLISNITGHSTVPYTFSNFVVNLDPTFGLLFNLLNDYGYTTFNLFSATGLTTPIVVNNVSQGPNLGLDSYYYWPFLGGHYYNIPNASQQYLDYGGTGDQFTNLTLFAYQPDNVVYSWSSELLGGAISLWDTHGVTANHISVIGGYGVWASTTSGTTVKNSFGLEGAAFSDIASTGAVGYNLTGYFGGDGVYEVGGTTGTFTYVNETDGFGVYGYWANSTTVKFVRADDYGTGVYVINGTSLSVTNIWSNASAEGVVGFALQKTTIADGSAWNNSLLVALVNGSSATITDVSANQSAGVELLTGFTGGTVTDVVAVNESLGILLETNVTGITITTVSTNDSMGVEIVGCPLAGVSITGVTSASHATGVGVETSGRITVATVSAHNYSDGVVVSYSSGVTITGVTASMHSEGVYGDASLGMAISGTKVTDGSWGVYLDRTTNVSVSDTTASDFSIGIYAVYTIATTITGVTATNGTLMDLYSAVSYLDGPYAAIDSYDNSEMMISGVVATTYPAALFDYESGGMQVSSVNATGGEYAIVLNDTNTGLFTGIGAYRDWQGVVLEDYAWENTVTQSAFVDDTSYGLVCAGFADGNYIFDNTFIGDNGATPNYSPSHIQASSSDYNYFDYCSESGCMGNYWSDWHTHTANGTMAPYVISGYSRDNYPIPGSVTATAGKAGEYTSIALIFVPVALFVVVVTLLALRHRKDRPSPTSRPAEWTPPPGATPPSGQGGTGNATWNEGSGGTPPKT